MSPTSYQTAPPRVKFGHYTPLKTIVNDSNRYCKYSLAIVDYISFTPDTSKMNGVNAELVHDR
ncbi:hypothetical protein [Desulforhopalus sp. 52FAK]